MRIGFSPIWEKQYYGSFKMGVLYFKDKGIELFLPDDLESEHLHRVPCKIPETPILSRPKSLNK